MAQSDNFFGLRKGSTKSLTFQTLRGKQITKDRVTHVANPQTKPQMLQRLKLVGVSSFVMQCKGLLNHSFEGVNYGYESLKYAKQVNLKKGNLTFKQYVPKGMMNTGLADFIVSKGTVIGPINEISGFRDNGSIILSQSLQKLYEGDTKPEAEDTPTPAQMAYIYKSIFFEKTDIDQMTILGLFFAGNYKYTDSRGVVRTAIRYQPAITRFVYSWATTQEGNTWEWDEEGNLVNGPWKLYCESGNAELRYNDTPAMAASVIWSQKINNEWKRSTSTLYINQDAPDITYDDVIYTYLESDAVSNKYLNEGEESTGIPGGDTDYKTFGNDTSTGA